MPRAALLALPLGLLLAMPAAAQHWNDAGPGKDLLSSTTADWDAFRQRAAAVAPPVAAAAGQPQQGQPRGPIPILDWVPPPAAAAPAPAAQTRRRSSGGGSVARRARPPSDPMLDPPLRDPAPRAAPVSAGGGEAERSLAERERELDRLRRILEEDRLRFQQRSQPQLQ